MKVRTSTGDPYDFVELEAESLAEASRLMTVATNKFVRDRDRIMLLCSEDAVRVRIRLSQVFEHGAATEINAAHDAEA